MHLNQFPHTFLLSNYSSIHDPTMSPSQLHVLLFLTLLSLLHPANIWICVKAFPGAWVASQEWLP